MHVLLRVHDLDLLPQLRDDGACPPAVFQRQVLQKNLKKGPELSINQEFSCVRVSQRL